ncbi:MAG: hypothetical protein JXR63_11805 [Spirochaetales bacterium]|nr:hypothetical protein [Spirochaetales bacterium]
MPQKILILSIETILILSFIFIIARIGILRIRIYNATTGRQALERFLKTKIAKKITKYSIIVEHVASKYDSQLPQKVGLDKYWSEKLFRKPKNHKLMKKVLRYAIPEGLFSAFYAGLSDKKNEILFKQHIEHTSTEKLLKETAERIAGRDFPSENALEMLKEFIDFLRKMTKSHKWEHRYFAFKILLQNTEDQRDIQLCKEAFLDPEIKIRNLAIREHKFIQEYYEEIYSRLINDPILYIRMNAKNRIFKDYKDYYKPDYPSLAQHQKIRFISELNFNFTLDKQIAYQVIREANEELSFPACRAMEKNKELSFIFLSIVLNDKEDYESKLFILKKAASFNCTTFLAEIKHANNAGSFYAATEILNEYGDQKYISDLASKVFLDIKKDINNPEYKDLYIKTTETISKRGDDIAFKLYRNEIQRNKEIPELIEILIKNIPEHEDTLFFETLITLFKDNKFTHREILFKKMLEMPEHRTIPAMFDILRDSSICAQIKSEALSILFKNNKRYYLQDIIENLNVLPLSESICIVNSLLTDNSNKVEETFRNILKQSDSTLTPALLRTLANTSFKTEIKKLIPDLLSNQVAEIRKAACYCVNLLHEAEKNKLIEPLLRDPISSVRETAILFFAENADNDELEEMINSIVDPNEFLSIKESAITGLAKSKNPGAFKAIIKVADFSEDIHPVVLEILKTTRELQKLREILRHYPISEKINKRLIEDLFSHFDINSQSVITDLIDEELTKEERQALNTILYKSGFIEKRIFELQNMSRNDRRKAVLLLSKIKEYHSARGLVYAAFDTDKKVCEIAIEAMKEFSAHNKDTSSMLLSDSNRIVRKQATLFYKKFHIEE